MSVEQVAHLLGGGFGQALRLALELAQLLDRDGDGRGEAGALLVDLLAADGIFRHRLIEMVADMGRTDGDAGRYGHAVEAVLLGEAPPACVGRAAIALARLLLHPSGPRPALRPRRRPLRRML